MRPVCEDCGSAAIDWLQRHRILAVFIVVAVPSLLHGQQVATDLNEPADVTHITAGPPEADGLSSARAIDESRVGPTGVESPTQFIGSLLRDQRTIWTSPVHLFNAKNRSKTLTTVIAVTGLVFLDPKDTPFFRRTTAFESFNHVLPGKATQWGLTILPISLYALGEIKTDRYLQRTAQLSVEALIDGEVVTTLLKDLDRRVRPIAVQGKDFGSTWFRDNGNGITGTGSFPSGHAVAAFAIASVISHRYPRRRWIPLMAYGVASAIGLSRITLCSHFPSEVFAGAVLGQLIGLRVPLGR